MKYLVAVLTITLAMAVFGHAADKEKKATLEQRVAWCEAQVVAAHNAFDAAEDQISELQDHVKALEGKQVVRARR